MKKSMMVLLMSLCFMCVVVSPAFAAQLTLTLTKTTDYSRTDFGTGNFTAYTMVWAGDVYLSGSKIGDFTATLTKTTYTSSASPINYDIIVPSGGTIPDFISVKTSHIPTGNGYDHGSIYATSPALSSLIGKTVTMNGATMTIAY